MFSHDYDSSFEDGESSKKRRHYEVIDKKESHYSYEGASSSEKGSRPKKNYECGIDEYRRYFNSFNAFDRHKILINQYLLYHPGATSLLKRDTSRDKTDWDVIRDNHQFLWEENDSIETWGKRIAKKYYNKLFKEYCICDLSRYKDGKVGMRWRTKKEVVEGKGQFSCGEKHCIIIDNIRTWEMNFGYLEGGVKKNALVKLRLCHDCSVKLNFKHRRREVKKKGRKKLRLEGNSYNIKKKEDPERGKDEDGDGGVEEGNSEDQQRKKEDEETEEEMNVWKKPPPILQEKEREEEFEEYLEDLFL